MKAVTYDQLDAALRSIGFTFRELDTVGAYTQRCYEHPADGALLIFPVRSGREPALPAHLAATRVVLEYFGLEAPPEFAVRLQAVR